MSTSSSPMIDPNLIRSHFPIFQHHPDLVYFDNAATTQRPQTTIDAVSKFYSERNANIHRGLYALSTDATADYESGREKVKDFIGANAGQSIAFTKGTTEGINVVANSFLGPRLQPGDNVVISAMEHHSNLIPWQQICLQKKAELRVIPVNKSGELEIDNIGDFLDNKTRMLAVTHISNTLGTINPVEQIVEIAHKNKVPVLIDAAQSVCLHPINVDMLGCDFLVFSSHKMFGPFGVGVLYVHPDHIEDILPYNYGGGMVTHVDFHKSSFMPYPHNLEAGTAAIAEVFGLSSAIDYLNKIDRLEASDYVHGLARYFKERLADIGTAAVVGSPETYAGIVSFQLDDIHPHDVATFLAEENIALRAGHHCTQPLLEQMGVNATLRASFSIYNSTEEIDHMVEILKKIQKFWA